MLHRPWKTIEPLFSIIIPLRGYIETMLKPNLIMPVLIPPPVNVMHPSHDLMYGR